MDVFPNGTQVFYWGAMGDITYGTVETTNHMADGMQHVVVVVKKDGKEERVTLP